jgi:hypothetical protein
MRTNFWDVLFWNVKWCGLIAIYWSCLHSLVNTSGRHLLSTAQGVLPFSVRSLSLGVFKNVFHSRALYSPFISCTSRVQLSIMWQYVHTDISNTNKHNLCEGLWQQTVMWTDESLKHCWGKVWGSHSGRYLTPQSLKMWYRGTNVSEQPATFSVERMTVVPVSHYTWHWHLSHTIDDIGTCLTL